MLQFQSTLILLLFALFSNHSDPPGRERDPENKTSSDCVDKKAVNSAFKAKGNGLQKNEDGNKNTALLTCRSVIPLKILRCEKERDTIKIHNCETENLEKGHHSVTGQILDNKIDYVIHS